MDDRMNILYLTHYFPPEVNAPALRVSEMGDRWADKGADVTVLTAFPNHPDGIIPEEYRGMMRLVARFKKLKLIRTYIYAAANKGFIKRIMNYLSFMFSSVFMGTSKVGRPHVLIATSPQFFVAVAGYVISRIKRCKFVFEVRDVWPEEIVAVGAIKNRFVIGALEALEMFLYRKADLVVAVAQGTIDILTLRGVPRSKLALIPNGVDIEHFASAPDGAEVRKRLGLENKFVACYLGTHGMAHRLGDVLDAANELRGQKDIRFLFVGNGADKQNLINRAKELKLDNVVFHDQIGREQIPEYYQAADLFLVPLRKAKLFTKNVPSKVYEIMASRRSILISTEGESRRLVESAGAGIGSTPEDAHEMAENILFLYKNKKLRRKMGEDGYTFALANASRKRLADDYLNILERLVAGETDFTDQAEKINVTVKQPEMTAEEEVSV